VEVKVAISAWLVEVPMVATLPYYCYPLVALMVALVVALFLNPLCPGVNQEEY
jgi:hypothetical protein